MKIISMTIKWLKKIHQEIVTHMAIDKNLIMEKGRITFYFRRTINMIQRTGSYQNNEIAGLIQNQ